MSPGAPSPSDAGFSGHFLWETRFGLYVVGRA